MGTPKAGAAGFVTTLWLSTTRLSPKPLRAAHQFREWLQADLNHDSSIQYAWDLAHLYQTTEKKVFLTKRQGGGFGSDIRVLKPLNSARTE
jgi:hypothetical protein